MSRDAAPDPVVLTYAAGIGEQETVMLEDGSQVVLNTASRVEVRYADTERRIALTAGQPLFEVRREARPFVVEAGGTETRALGTRFDVYLPKGDGVQVTLLEGFVRVSEDAAGGNVILSPGEQMTLRAGERTVSSVDTSQFKTWAPGMIPFTDVTLAIVAAQLNRYSATKIRVDEAIAGGRISGAFRAGDQEGFATALEAFMQVTAERRRDETPIRRRQ